jgi:hypothetical protein
MTAELDIVARRVSPPGRTLTLQQFSLVVYLALRRQGAMDGWVTLEEIVRTAPAWTDKKAEVAGRVISRMSTEAWFEPLVEYERVARGAYRFREARPVFRPDRDAANEFMATKPRSRKKSEPGGRSRPRGFAREELAAYDLLVPYGIYLPEVIDLILRRLGDPSTMANPDDRILGYKILMTLQKNRGNTASARKRAEQGLVLSRKLHRIDEVAYFLDQIGGTYHIEGRAAEARRAFEGEVEFLKAWERSAPCSIS